MAHQRTPSTLDAHKEPHAVSLKVLRLSRPSLATQYPLPRRSPSTADASLPAAATLAYPSANSSDRFILTPLLTLPPSFGSAYVGETFSCTLCANNELPASSTSKSINSVRITAEIQTPSQTIPLELSPGTEHSSVKGASLEPAESLQKIVKHDLKEEGNHVLTVTVTYSETALVGEGKASGGRVRTFRKLYQFLVKQCLAVRTKAGELGQVKGETRALRYVLEAQLENMAEESLCLEIPRQTVLMLGEMEQSVSITPKAPFQSTSLNWDINTTTGGEIGKKALPVVNPRDVTQVAFLIEVRKDADEEDVEKVKKDVARDGRAVLGQLCIEWRGAMGEKGFLSTGWLSSRKRP